MFECGFIYLSMLSIKVDKEMIKGHTFKTKHLFLHKEQGNYIQIQFYYKGFELKKITKIIFFKFLKIIPFSQIMKIYLYVWFVYMPHDQSHGLKKKLKSVKINYCSLFMPNTHL